LFDDVGLCHERRVTGKPPASKLVGARTEHNRVDAVVAADQRAADE